MTLDSLPPALRSSEGALNLIKLHQIVKAGAVVALMVLRSRTGREYWVNISVQQMCPLDCSDRTEA